jgi:hypothetical protein
MSRNADDMGMPPPNAAKRLRPPEPPTDSMIQRGVEALRAARAENANDEATVSIIWSWMALEQQDLQKS